MKIFVAACAAMLVVGGGAVYSLSGTSPASQQVMSFGAPKPMPALDSQNDAARLTTATAPVATDPIATKIAPPVPVIWPEVQKPKTVNQAATPAKPKVAAKPKKKKKKQPTQITAQSAF